MFEGLEKEPSLGSWTLQLSLASCGPLLALMITEKCVSLGPGGPILTLFQYSFIGVVSVLIASILSAVTPDSVVEGRWVWVLPVVLFLIAFASEALRHIREVTYMFYVRPGEGEAGWLMVLLTMPTWSCCSYSLTMSLWRRHRAGQRNSLPR